jgi:hypothetical protein
VDVHILEIKKKKKEKKRYSKFVVLAEVFILCTQHHVQVVLRVAY